MSATQNQKSKFRASSKWKKFRSQMKTERKIDYITQKRLLKGWNLHHLDLNEQNYQDISDKTKFVCLNKMTHEIVHDLYRYYVKDPEVLDRLKEVLERMREINL